MTIEEAVEHERVTEVTGADGPALVLKIRKLGTDDRLAVLAWVRE